MQLSLCIVTDQVDVMRRFYEPLLSVEATGSPEYIEFAAGVDWRLALCATGAIEFAAPGAHVPGTNRAVRIELPVDDVDAAYARMVPLASESVVPPTDWPWGARAAWLRDPDGNLVSLFRFSD